MLCFQGHPQNSPMNLDNLLILHLFSCRPMVVSEESNLWIEKSKFNKKLKKIEKNRKKGKKSKLKKFKKKKKINKKK